MSRLKTVLKYGAVVGASFGIGYTVGGAVERISNESSDTDEPTHRTMEYDIDRAKSLLQQMDSRVETLERYDLHHEVEHLRSAAEKLQSGVLKAEMDNREQVNVPINAEEFAAWMISVLGQQGANNGTGRQEQGPDE
jgi:hypothetical protein